MRIRFDPMSVPFAGIGRRSSVAELGGSSYKGGFFKEGFFRGHLIRSMLSFIGHKMDIHDLGSDRWTRRNAVQQGKQDVVQGLFVEIKTETLRERLDEAARQINARVDALEGGDFSGLASRYSDEDVEEMPAKRQKKVAQRHIGRLRDALAQIAFIREHLIEGVYRLDFDDARRLATIHVDLDH